MKINETWLIALGLTLPLMGCPGDDDGTTTTTNADTGNTSTAESGSTAATDPTTAGSTSMGDDSTTAADDGMTTGAQMCLGEGEGMGAEGEACTANSDCASGVCTLFTDVPVNEDAVCAPVPEGCATRVTGTLFDFTTNEAVSGADLVVAAALQAATNPTMAQPLVMATSGGDGRVDGTSDGPIMAPIGIIGLASAGGYYLTATGIASPGEDMQSYAVGTNIHDLWLVPEQDLADWSDELANDAMIPPDNLPLGDAGGVVGLVRDGAGLPIAGATVASTDGASGAFIRYLNDDGTFSETETSDLGIFVILAPGLAEAFEATVDGAVVGGGSAGSADGAIFTLVVDTGL